MGAAWGDNLGRADVLAFSPEGGAPIPFATGLRNCSAEATQPATGALWCAVNERDGLGDDLPPDYATRVEAGAFYGWPWFYLGGHPDPRMGGARMDLAGHVTVPDVLIQAHSAPVGMVFYDAGAFPAEYRGDAFVALHGSWNRSKRTGYKVVRLRFQDGKPTGVYEDFLTGFVASDQAVWGRPVGLTVMGDGSLLVSEDANGTIWRVAYRAEP
jgi:glucose/arabinose dehydrogenase